MVRVTRPNLYLQSHINPNLINLPSVKLSATLPHILITIINVAAIQILNCSGREKERRAKESTRVKDGLGQCR